MVDMDGQADKKEKKSGKRYSLLCLGKEFLAQKGRKGKTRMTQSPVACFLHSLEEENYPHKLGMNHCSSSQSLVAKASASALPGTC